MTQPTGTDADTRCADYVRIAGALAWLAERRDAQPDLGALADAAGLSPSHLQRVFTRWVGISPKRFLQYLALDHARARLAASATVLDASWDAGLSGPGRLHDLFVTHSAMTPGEFRRRGEGLRLRVGTHATPFGPCALCLSDRGLCALAFQPPTHGSPLDELRGRFPLATFVPDHDATAAVIAQVFPVGDSARSPLHLDLRGTAFQLQVWEALLRIPEGALVSYEGLAARLGRPGSARAVGAAVAANPVAYVVPCHRVIRASGVLCGYHWGTARKMALLGWEGRASGV